jgi:Zn-dependent metalloprotease
VDPTSDWVVIVDALNGNVLSAFNQVNTTAAIGSGFDLQNQLRHLNVWNENNAYYLIDTSKSMYQYGSNPPGLQETNGAIFVLDLQNKDLPQQGGTFSASYVVSPYANSGWLKDGVSLSYNLSQTYDYFEEVHNRNSIDGMGGNIIGLVRTGQNFNNAFWTSEYNAVFFGDAKPYAAALDIVAHEITHGITSFSCNLVYRDQPGALNEAFSDIFGEMVEARTGGTTDWMNGTVFNDNTGRSLKDPSSVEIIPGRGFYYPSKMGAFYYRGSPLLQLLRDEDYGGVHINMTIITHAFYLLAEGLNDAIGIDKAAKIFYRAQNVHLVANSQFIDMRLACIQSAEELYGANSHEVQKVIDAFDRVEIVDDQPTPDPDPTPPVTGKDSYIFVSYDSVNSDYYLARRETSKNDGTEGGRLSTYPVKQARPSISGDGEYAFFIDSFDEGCFIATDGSEVEECLNEGYPMHSVAMSPDQKLYGFVMLDDNGNPQDKIVVIDVRPGGGTKEYDLAAPGTEGYVVETVLHADSMDFTSDNRYLIYDAFNVLKLMDGTVVGAWSIYAIDLLTDQIISLVPPVPGYDIGYPSLSQTTNHLLTYDLYDTATGISTIVAGHLLTGQLAAVSTVDGDYGVPSFNGNDTAIAYTQIDNSQPTGHSIDLQPLAENGFNPEGSSSRDLLNAKFGVIYRRGPFIAPVADISVATTNLRFDNVYQYEAKTQALGIENKGATNLLIQKISITGTDAPMFTVKGGCPGQSLPSGGSCAMQVEFKPSTLGTKAAVIAISSNDPDTPIVKVSVIGTGITNPNDTDGDGVVNDLDDFPDNPNEWLDTDRDGVGNNSDPDDDGDGFSDETEKEKGTDPLDAGDFPGKSAGIAPILNLLLDE